MIDIRTERKISVNDETRTILWNKLGAKQTATRWVVFTSDNVVLDHRQWPDDDCDGPVNERKKENKFDRRR